jgi:hypothetical protein
MISDVVKIYMHTTLKFDLPARSTNVISATTVACVTFANNRLGPTQFYGAGQARLHKWEKTPRVHGQKNRCCWCLNVITSSPHFREMIPVVQYRILESWNRDIIYFLTFWSFSKAITFAFLNRKSERSYPIILHDLGYHVIIVWPMGDSDNICF